MRLTAYTDYTLRVLMYLGLKGDARATIKEISDCYGISKKHLMKIVQDLSREGVLNTVRGKSGGIRLARPAESSEEHTSELQSLMSISYAVFCLKKNTDIAR